MLQIITGRFFKTAELHRTQQRTVLYSNYRGHDAIETVVGSYAPAASSADVASAVYLVEQRLEAVHPDGSRSVVIAVHPEALAQDFAALLSFCLRVTCTLDSALVSRLTQSNRPPIGVSNHPYRMVDQIFDREVWPSQVDEAVLPQFVAELVRLERARYRAVMRAIQRYVVGLHRIGDDLALAYTLLVASIESLAHDFDQFEPSWRDFDPGKRKRIDQALADTFATSETIGAVQSATLENEHVALSRRYREFALAYLPSSFYREEVAGREGSARACDLPLALSRAYAFRSKLVHRLEALPSLLVHAPLPWDIIEVDGKPALTFSGLARVARRVIMRFVELSPKLDTEDFDYWADLPGVVSVPLAPRYWIWRNYHPSNARKFLSGFLSQLESVLLGVEKEFPDIRNVLEEVERRVPELALASRLPMVSLYLLYHRYLPKEWHRPAAEEFIRKHISLFDDPSLESLICYTVISQSTGWDPDKQEEMRRAYLKQRYNKNGLKLGPVLEVAVTLETAEAYRLAGDSQRAQKLLSDAVENLPGSAILLDLEKKYLAGEFVPLRWRDILLPNQELGDGVSPS